MLVSKDSLLSNYDVTIIGAGAAGISIADRLRKSRLKVLIVEAGGLKYSENSQKFYEGEWINNVQGDYVKVKDRTKSDRLRYFGGSTNHWAGRVRRFDKVDFETRDYISESGWPIKYDDLESFYVSAEKVLDIEHEHHVLNEKNKKSEIFEHNYFSFSPPTRLGSKYFEDIRESHNIHLLLNTSLVSQKLLDDKFVPVFKVQGDNTFQVESTNFILCNGGLESIRTMLLIDGQANLPFSEIIGKYYMGHAIYHPSTIFVNDSFPTEKFQVRYARFFHNESHEISSLFQKFRLKLGLRNTVSITDQRKIPQMFFHLSEKSQYIHRLPNLGYTLHNSHTPDNQDLKFLQSEGSLSKKFKSFQLLNRGEQIPIRESYVSLLNNKDQNGNPQIKVNWKFSESDEKNIFYSNRLLNQHLKNCGWGILRDEVSRSAIPKSMWTGAHHLGGTRMGQDTKRSVVDSNLRVHGISNLFVASSSVFCTSGVANPTLTVTALALRLAEYLVQNYE